jgi:lysozyme
MKAEFMRISPKGKQFIAAREAFVSVPYPDGKYKNGLPRWSQGFGGPSTEFAQPITLEQAWNALDDKIREYEVYVARHYKGVGMTQQMFDALVSLYYQAGPGGKETLQEVMRRGDVIAAADTLLTYNKKGGKVNAGHVKRRQQERDLFLRGIYGDLRSVNFWDTTDIRKETMQILPMPEYSP